MATERNEMGKDNFKETKQKPGSELPDNKGRACQNLFLTYRRLETHETWTEWNTREGNSSCREESELAY